MSPAMPAKQWNHATVDGRWSPESERPEPNPVTPTLDPGLTAETDTNDLTGPLQEERELTRGDVLAVMSNGTGGVGYHNTNRLDGAISQVSWSVSGAGATTTASRNAGQKFHPSRTVNW